MPDLEAVDCQGYWGSWSECDASCGTNLTQHRTFVVDTEPQNAGQVCQADDQSVEDKACGVPSCRETSNADPTLINLPIWALGVMGGVAALVIIGIIVGVILGVRHGAKGKGRYKTHVIRARTDAQLDAIQDHLTTDITTLIIPEPAINLTSNTPTVASGGAGRVLKCQIELPIQSPSGDVIPEQTIVVSRCVCVVLCFL